MKFLFVLLTLAVAFEIFGPAFFTWVFKVTGVTAGDKEQPRVYSRADIRHMDKESQYRKEVRAANAKAFRERYPDFAAQITLEENGTTARLKG